MIFGVFVKFCFLLGEGVECFTVFFGIVRHDEQDEVADAFHAYVVRVDIHADPLGGVRAAADLRFQLVDVGTVLDTHEANGKRNGVDERLARDGFFKIEVFDAEVVRRLVFRNLDRADAVFEKIALLVIDIYGVIQAVYNLRQRA